MKTMKTLSSRIAALLLVVTVGITALAPAASAANIQLPRLPKDQCVVDDAGVLSDSTTSELKTLNAQLSSSCDGAQIGVLTVDYTGSATTEDYATEAFNTWGIGSSSENNGVLILLVMESQEYEDGDYYLTYSDGFRNTTLESQASALAQTMEDDFVRQDYDDAVTTCARNVAQTIADIYGVSLSGGNTNNGSYNEPAYDDNSSGGGFGDILLGFVTILFTIILLLIIVSVILYTFSGPLSGLFWCFGGPWHRGPRPPRGRRNPPPPPPGGPYGGGFGGPGPGGPGGRGPRNSPPPRRTPPRSTPPRSGGFGGGSFGGGSFGGGSFGGGSFGGMGGGSSHGGGGGRGR